jgi:hypothetical protein
MRHLGACNGGLPCVLSLWAPLVRGYETFEMLLQNQERLFLLVFSFLPVYCTYHRVLLGAPCVVMA